MLHIEGVCKRRTCVLLVKCGEACGARPRWVAVAAGHAVRVPLTNASITDAVFEVKKAVTAEEVNGLLREAAAGELKNILQVRHARPRATKSAFGGACGSQQLALDPACSTPAG